MNYEEAWNDLKAYATMYTRMSTNWAGSEDRSDAQRLQAAGGEFFGREILRFMDMAENAIAAAREKE